MANRIKVKGYTRSDGVKVKSHIKRGPSSETYGKGYRWDKKHNLLIPTKRKRR